MVSRSIGAQAVRPRPVSRQADSRHLLARPSDCDLFQDVDVLEALTFVLRLLAEEGLSFRFEHTDPQDDAPAFHTLVIFDEQSEAPLCPQPQIRFHRAHATEADDAFQRWHEHRRTAANRASLSGWDYKRLLASGALAESADPAVARGAGKGIQIFARIDHADGAAKAGLNLSPTQLLILGHPRPAPPS